MITTMMLKEKNKKNWFLSFLNVSFALSIDPLCECVRMTKDQKGLRKEGELLRLLSLL